METDEEMIDRWNKKYITWNWCENCKCVTKQETNFCGTESECKECGIVKHRQDYYDWWNDD